MVNVEQKEKKQKKRRSYVVGMCDRLKVYSGRVFALF